MKLQLREFNENDMTTRTPPMHNEGKDPVCTAGSGGPLVTNE